MVAPHINSDAAVDLNMEVAHNVFDVMPLRLEPVIIELQRQRAPVVVIAHQKTTEQRRSTTCSPHALQTGPTQGTSASGGAGVAAAATPVQSCLCRGLLTSRPLHRGGDTGSHHLRRDHPTSPLRPAMAASPLSQPKQASRLAESVPAPPGQYSESPTSRATIEIDNAQ